jgi:hypothetical protein
MANELREGFMKMTGSRAGFDAGVECLPLDAIDKTRQGESDKVQTVCANGFWAKQCWRPELYFAMRDKQWNAKVTVGPIEEKGK